MKLMQKNCKYMIFLSQKPVWICCNCEAVAYHTRETPQRMAERCRGGIFRFASSVAEHTWVWSLQMSLGRAVRHDVGSSSSSLALGAEIIKITLAAWSPLSCSVESKGHTSLKAIPHSWWGRSYCRTFSISCR